MQKGHRYSRKNILFSEFEVLNLVGYKVKYKECNESKILIYKQLL